MAALSFPLLKKGIGGATTSCSPHSTFSLSTVTAAFRQVLAVSITRAKAPNRWIVRHAALHQLALRSG